MGLAQNSEQPKPQPTAETSGKANSTAVFSGGEAGANSGGAAKRQKWHGVVRVRIEFLASGQIGEVALVSGAPDDDINKQALAAARSIKFEPAKRGGKPVDTTKIVEYTFTIFYEENDDELAQNAEIVKMPEPEHPGKGDAKKIGGKVKVGVTLNADGSVSVLSASTDLPREFEEAARKAAAKIKFKPAIHKNGNAVDMKKTIEYEFKPKND